MTIDLEVPTLPFRPVSMESWLQPDPVVAMFPTIRRTDGAVRAGCAEDWLGRFSEPQLSANVPTDVVVLFEAARGALCYGYFFRPLFALGCGQLYRVVETAVKLRVPGSASMKRPTYEKRIAWLIEQGIIPQDRKAYWDAFRGLRNSASHPDYQTTIPPNQAVGSLRHAAEAINSLFEVR